MVYAQVIVSSRTNVQELSYAVPASIIPYIRPGSTVLVPLRRQNVRGVVVALTRHVAREIKGKIREISSVDRTGAGFSPAQIATIHALADKTGASLAEIAYAALAYPSGLTPEKTLIQKPTFVQAPWEKRLDFYRKLANKYEGLKRVVIVLPTEQHAAAVAAAIGSTAVVAEPPRASKTKRITEALANRQPLTIIGGQSLAFFPLRPGDFLIIDSPDHVSQTALRRPYLSTKTIGLERAKHEGIHLILGAEIVAVADYPKKLRRDWRFAVDRSEPLSLTVINRQRSPSLLVESFEEKLRQAADQKNLVFVASKGFSPILYCPACQDVCRCPNCQRTVVLATAAKVVCRFCLWSAPRPTVCDKTGAELVVLGEGTQLVSQTIAAALPDQKIIEISSDTSNRPTGNLVVATEKILSFPTERFDNVFIASADRMLSAADPDGAWHLLQIVLALGARAKEIVAQTYFPDHWVWSAAASGQLASFYRRELKERQEYQLPPYSQEITVFGRSDDRQRLTSQADQVQQALSSLLPAATVGESIITRPNPRELMAHLTAYTVKPLSTAEKIKLRQLLPISWYLRAS